MNQTTQLLLTAILFAFMAPFVPLLITMAYYIDDPEEVSKFVQPSDVVTLFTLLIPLHAIVLYSVLQQKSKYAWPLGGLFIGIIQAMLGRYYFNLPGNVWLKDHPNSIFIVAPIIWISIYSGLSILS